VYITVRLDIFPHVYYIHTYKLTLYFLCEKNCLTVRAYIEVNPLNRLFVRNNRYTYITVPLIGGSRPGPHKKYFFFAKTLVLIPDRQLNTAEAGVPFVNCIELAEMRRRQDDRTSFEIRAMCTDGLSLPTTLQSRIERDTTEECVHPRVCSAHTVLPSHIIFLPFFSP
jgi:hypothetical protein